MKRKSFKWIFLFSTFLVLFIICFYLWQNSNFHTKQCDRQRKCFRINFECTSLAYEFNEKSVCVSKNTLIKKCIMTCSFQINLRFISLMGKTFTKCRNICITVKYQKLILHEMCLKRVFGQWCQNYLLDSWNYFICPNPLFGQRSTSYLATLHMIAILKEVKCISQHIKRIIHKYILNISMTCHILFLLHYIHIWGFYEQI